MAIRLIFVTMKKILNLIFVCVLCGVSYAQDMEITFSGNSATIKIDGNSPIIGNKICELKEIRTIHISETQKLALPQKHHLKINGSAIKLSDDDAYLVESATYTLNNPFTLKYGNKIEVYRDTLLCGTFNNTNSESLKKYIDNKVTFTMTDTINYLKKGKKREVIVTVKHPCNITLENVKVLKNNANIESSFNKGKLNFELSLEENEDSAGIKIIYDIKNQPNLKGIEHALYTIKKEHSLFDCTEYMIMGFFALIFGSITIIFIVFWFSKSTLIEFENKKNLRLLVSKSGKITKGTKSLSSGTFERSDGYVYKLKRQKWYNLFSRVYFVGVKIHCSDKKSFILEDCDNLQDNVGQVHYINNAIDKIIAVGMKACSDGKYELEDKNIITIEKGEIHEVRKYIYSTRNTTHYITLNSDEPQINDLVTPSKNKKTYVIETTDGIRYDIFSMRIQKISNTNSMVTNQIELVATNGKKITVIPKGDVPSEGDIAIAADGEYIIENMVYVIKEGNIKSIRPKKEQYTQSELLESLKLLREENEKLKSRPTKESFDLLKDQNKEVNAELTNLKKKYENIDETIETAKAEAKAEEKKRLDIIHKKDIINNYILLSEHKQQLDKSDKLSKEAVAAKERTEKTLRQKELELTTASDKISNLEKVVLEKETEIITQKAVIAKLKDVAQKKNVHFVCQVQETLEDISNTFKDVYKDMTNATIKNGFISPMLKGVSGLGAGILSWAEDYTVKVNGDSEGFFGGDFMTMKEEDVKETISKKFISNIVKSDSFSKFVRLYQLSCVPFIRKQFIEAGMNIDVLNKLYYKVYVLVSEFGYQIICPRLFEEQYSDKKYQWFNSTNLFNIINLPEEEKKAIKDLGSETIIDVNQIGFTSPWASRNATAVTPDF